MICRIIIAITSFTIKHATNEFCAINPPTQSNDIPKTSFPVKYVNDLINIGNSHSAKAQQNPRILPIIIGFVMILIKIPLTKLETESFTPVSFSCFFDKYKPDKTKYIGVVIKSLLNEIKDTTTLFSDPQIASKIGIPITK